MKKLIVLFSILFGFESYSQQTANYDENLISEDWKKFLDFTDLQFGKPLRHDSK